jgi:threonine/homoserine/homoserine lactone efflux protein
MPSIGSLTAFAAVSLALLVIPGPSVMFVVSRAVALGRRAALYTVVGNAAGVYVQVVFVALGLGAVVERSAAVFTAVKLIGAVYLVWLGVQAIRQRRSSGVSGEPTVLLAPRGAGPLMRDGFIVGLANPKTIIFFAAILPQFVASGGAPVALQMAGLGLIFVGIGLLSDGAWGLAAGTARQWLARSPRRLELLGAAGGVAIVGLGLQLAISGRSA